MGESEELPRYRLLTGPDDAAFCKRVSEALDQGVRAVRVAGADLQRYAGDRRPGRDTPPGPILIGRSFVHRSASQPDVRIDNKQAPLSKKAGPLQGRKAKGLGFVKSD